MPRDYTSDFSSKTNISGAHIAWPNVAHSTSKHNDFAVQNLKGATPISLPQDPVARRKALSAFSQANKAATLAGGTAFVLVLLSAEGVQAQQAAGPVTLSSVNGVDGAQVLADGSVQVSLDNGQKFTLSSDAVVVNPDGSILVSQAVADGLASAATAAAGASPVALAAAIGGGALGLAGLGGGSGSSSAGESSGSTGASTPSPILVSGNVIDGYLVGATVFRDANDNGTLDDGELHTTTGANGAWTLAIDPSAPNAKLVSIGGVDASTGKAFTGVLTAPADSTVVTPLTTLVQALVEQSANTDNPLSADKAATQMAEALGLGDVNLLELDPVEQAAGGDTNAMKVAAKVAAVINVGASGAEGEADVASATESIAASLVTSIVAANDQPGNGKDALDSAAVIESALEEGRVSSANLEAAASKLLVANNEINGATNLSDIETVQEVVQGGLVEAVKAAEGGESEALDEFDLKDEVGATAPLKPQVEIATLKIGGTTSEVTISGGGKVGTLIRVTIGDETFNTTVGASETKGAADTGTWSVKVQTSDFTQDGTFDVKVSASFADTNTYTDPVAAGKVIVDTTGPAVTLDAIAGDDVISKAEASGGEIIVSGETEANTSVTVTFGEIKPQTVDSNGQGVFSATFETSALPESDGDITVSAVATDDFGNNGTVASKTVTLDTTAPEVTLNAVEGDNTVSGSEATDGVEVSGKTEADASVEVSLGLSNQTVTANGDGVFTATFTGDNIPADGQPIFAATATDAAGNASQKATQTVTIDTTGPTVTLNDVAEDNVITASEASDDIEISGTTENGASVSVTFGTVTKDAVVSEGGAFTATFASNEIPDTDGSVAISATATDQYGNAGDEAKASVIVDTTGPAVTLDAVAGDDVISKEETSGGGIIVSGITEANTSVTVTLGEINPQTVDSNEQGVFSAVFDSRELPAAQDITVFAVATDDLGNIGRTASKTVTVDTEAPEVTLNAVEGDNTVSGSEATDGVEVSGTTEADASVEVSLGSSNQTVTANGDGVFTATFTGDNIPADGQPIFAATATDAAGNAGKKAVEIVTIDTTGPTVTLKDVAEDNVITASEASGNIEISGTTEDGASVSVTFGTVTKDVVASEDGAFTATFASNEIPDTDGSVAISATATDQYGNAGAEAKASVTVATTGPGVALDAIAGDNVVSGVELFGDVVITGTTAGAVSVAVTYGETTVDAVMGENNNSFTATIANAVIPKAGEVAISAVATDALGNKGTAAKATLTVEDLPREATVTINAPINMFQSEPDEQDTRVWLDGTLKEALSVEPIYGDGDGIVTFSDQQSGSNVVLTVSPFPDAPAPTANDPTGIVTNIAVSGPLAPNAFVFSGVFFTLADVLAAAAATQHNTDGHDPFEAIEALFADHKVTINGSSGNDSLFFRAKEVVINGNGGSDELHSSAGNDVLSGGADSDFFGATAGYDTIDGGVGGSDHVNYQWAESDSGIESGVNANLETGSATIGEFTHVLTDLEEITGTNYADTITGPNNGDAFSQIRGLGGADVLTGGTGTHDLLSYRRDADAGGENDGNSGVTINFQTGLATDGFGDEDTISGFEQAEGTDFADHITMEDTISGDRWINARGGDDTVVSAQSSDTINDDVGVFLGEGSDHVIFRGGRMWLEDFTLGEDKLELSDALYAKFLTATMSDYSGTDDNGNAYGGAYIDFGDGDRIEFNGWSSQYFPALEIVNDAPSGELFSGTNGENDTLVGGIGNDTLDGGTGDDTYTGNAGADTFVLRYGDYVITDFNQADGDTIQGEGVFYHQNSESLIKEELEGSGVKVVFDQDNSATFTNLTLTEVNAVLASGAGGGGNNNSSLIPILGMDGSDDVLTGSPGDDLLDGGTGNDTYTGDAGADIFVLQQGHYVITDFNPEEDDIRGESQSIFDDNIALDAATIGLVNDESVTGVRISLNDANSLTIQNLTLPQVQDFLVSSSGGDNGGGDDPNAYAYSGPSENAMVLEYGQSVDIAANVTGALMSVDPVITATLATFTYSFPDSDPHLVQTFEMVLTGTGFGVGDEGLTGNVSSMVINETTDGSNVMLAQVTNVGLPVADFTALVQRNVESVAEEAVGIDATGSTFATSERDLVIIDGDAGNPSLVANGVQTFVFTGDGNDTTYAASGHTGVNVISVEGGSDTVVIGYDAQPTHIIIDTDGDDASGVVHVDGFTVGNNSGSGDLLVVQDSDDFNWIHIISPIGSVDNLSDVNTALQDQYGAPGAGSNGYILVTDNDNEAVVYKFSVDVDNIASVGDRVATMTDISYTSDVGDGDFYQYIKYIDDTPVAPEFA